MENSERQRFEENWKSAFENAEQSPSERVWSSIENSLTYAEGGTMRRKVVFYRRLAAASVVLALALAGSTTYYLMNDKREELAVTNNSSQNQRIQQNESNAENLSNAKNTANDNTKTQITSEDKPEKFKPQVEKGQNQIQLVDTPLVAIVNNTQLEFADVNPVSRLQRFGLSAYDPLAESYLIELNPKSKVRGVTIVRKLPAMPASMMADSRKRNEVKENLWAAVNASTGSYTSYSQADNSRAGLVMSTSNSFGSQVSASSTVKPKGSAYSVGVNMGTRISERWVLQGGVAYLNQSLGYTSNFAALDANNAPMAIVSEYSALKQNSIALSPTTRYDINSVNELVSVPIQTGYMVVNRKFGLQLNSGVATDMFIRNTLTDKSGQLSTFSESAGSDSPYNTFSWSAIGGTELSYKIGSQYRVSLTPGFRYALSPMLKSNSENTNPFMWDMGFRFRYILK